MANRMPRMNCSEGPSATIGSVTGRMYSRVVGASNAVRYSSSLSASSPMTKYVTVCTTIVLTVSPGNVTVGEPPSIVRVCMVSPSGAGLSEMLRSNQPSSSLDPIVVCDSSTDDVDQPRAVLQPVFAGATL